MRSLLFATALLATAPLAAQLPFIDYGFLADDPSVQVYKVLVQPDGKILVGGFFLDYAGTGRQHLVRLNSDGSLDTSFNPGGTGPDNGVVDMVLMPDGRILICGSFLNYNSATSYFIARLHADGTLDTTFSVAPNSINGAVWAIDLQGEHDVIAGGEFFVCSGHSMPHIARFTNTGALDTTFQVGTGFSHNVRDILVLADHRIVVGGQFEQYDGAVSGHIALLQANGPLDPSMDCDPGLVGSFGEVHTLALQPDGMLLAGGYFQYHDGQPRSAIERLHMDGSHDPAFSSPLYAYSKVHAIAVQPDGKIVVGGEFTSGEYANMQGGPERLVRLNADGTRDLTFAIGTGLGLGGQPTAYAESIAVQADGRILVGGHFGTVDSETQYQQLVRLYGTGANAVPEAPTPTPLQAWSDADGALWLRPPATTPTGTRVELHDLTGRLLYSAELPGGDRLHRLPVPATSGLYLVRLLADGQGTTTRVAVE